MTYLADHKNRIKTPKTLAKKLIRTPSDSGKTENIDGWTVTKSGDYWKMYKKIKGRTYGVHIGAKKTVKNIQKARKKAKAKEEELYRANLDDRKTLKVIKDKTKAITDEFGLANIVEEVIEDHF